MAECKEDTNFKILYWVGMIEVNGSWERFGIFFNFIVEFSMI